MAFLLPEPQCPLSLVPIIKLNGTEIPEVIDSNPATCLTLPEKARLWSQILLPYIRIKGQFCVSLFGNLKCSPVNGMSVSIIGDCDNGTGSSSRCIASELVTSDEIRGCKYRCRSLSVCNHIIVDIAGVDNNYLRVSNAENISISLRHHVVNYRD